MSPNLGISLAGPRPWLKCHFFHIFYFTFIFHLLDYENNISHQRFTEVVPCIKSTYSAHWLFFFLFFNDLNESFPTKLILGGIFT